MMGDNGAAACSKAKVWIVAIERDGRFYFKYSCCIDAAKSDGTR